MKLSHYNRRIISRLRPLFDLSSWILFSLSLMPLYLIDPVMVKTLIQWSAFSLAIAGLSIMLTRIMFPQIHLTHLINQIFHEKNIAAGLVVAGLLVFMGLLILSLLLWAKA